MDALYMIYLIKCCIDYTFLYFLGNNAYVKQNICLLSINKLVCLVIEQSFNVYIILTRMF